MNVFVIPQANGTYIVEVRQGEDKEWLRRTTCANEEQAITYANGVVDGIKAAAMVVSSPLGFKFERN